MSLGSPAEDENGGISLRATANVRRGFCPSAASVMPAWIAGIQPAGCVRTHPCQPGFRQSMPERRALL